MPKELVNSTYLKLLNQLKSILIEGLRAIEEQRVKTYWKTGELISKFLLENKERAGYGDRLFERLSEDLEIGQRTLERSVQFYSTFPIPSTLTELGWSHYLALLTIGGKNKRLALQSRAIKQGWSVEQLREAIRIERLRNKEVEEVEIESDQASPTLRVVRGRLYIYKLLLPEIINLTEAKFVIDCGFRLFRDIPIKGIANPQENQIVESSKTETGYRFKPTDAKKSHLYTYKAFVQRVIDADTIWVLIDLGFNNWIKQKLRFRGIDAPELSTKKGERAKEFVETRLSQVPFIIIKTHSPDKYGRYLTDVFYLAGEENPHRVLEEGIFLNQELLSAGLAEEMKD